MPLPVVFDPKNASLFTFDAPSKSSQPYLVRDDFLNESFATALQEEIAALPEEKFDKYNNPFEDKKTLLKTNFGPLATEAFAALQSPEFVTELELLTGFKLVVDAHKHYWGIHEFENGGHLDVHVDAGIHPIMHLKKYLTICLYLSKEWKPEYGGALELWSGDDVTTVTEPRIDAPFKSIDCNFNRAVIFINTDTAWHGSPKPTTPPTISKARRFLLTLSYMLAPDQQDLYCKAKHERAYFAARRSQTEDPLRELRQKRASSMTCKDVYRYEKKEEAAKQEFKIWHLQTVSMGSNQHGIDRSETWKAVLLPESYPTERAAATAIKQKTCSDPTTCGAVGPHLIGLSSPEAKDDFLTQFCFDSKSDLYMPYRRFFLEKPADELVKKMCEKMGASFIKTH